MGGNKQRMEESRAADRQITESAVRSRVVSNTAGQRPIRARLLEGFIRVEMDAAALSCTFVVLTPVALPRPISYSSRICRSSSPRRFPIRFCRT